MVSTRQMTIGNNGSVESNQPPTVPTEGPAKFTRNSAAASTSFNGTMQYCKALSPSPPVQLIYFLDLPQEIIEKIFSYLSFKNICQLRLVCRAIDYICGQVLNSTFLRLQNQMLSRFQEIKAKMPRRESARRSHHLACESDIIETLHMRLTLLQMSFGKHIERKHCCFFPGEILDEVYRILHYIKVTSKLDLPYKVTDELFDLSTMAMEYFKEKIEPNLPEIAYFSADFLNFSGSFPYSSKYLSLDSSALSSEVSKDSGHVSTDELEGEDLVETIPQSNMVLRKRIRKIKQGMKRYNSQLSLLRQDLRSCKRKTSDQQKQISEQQKQLADQQKQTLEYATRLDDYDKKNEEISRKFSTLLQELNKCKTELQYWRCKSPASPPFCNNCGNAILPQPEELQALMNQGVNPEGLGLEPPPEVVPVLGANVENNVEEEDKSDNNRNIDKKPAVEQPSTSAGSVKNIKRKSEEAKEEATTKKDTSAF
ncbi:hypothetical protein NQ314_013418 [Rhamnusium bicolor]|uniref:F-box domain-containing protein n=1 Tax=Rhamnusium bicolor TaxID=1586634 RepID=A0AAV8X5Z3_9CUCU|nr:hypothetical protein NQ314_013418 [Rhamnusium bicolor]